MSSELQDVITALSDPRTYPHGPESVDIVQTHISVVFIAGDLVYKIKKPLNLGFLDFTSLEKRRHFCCQEVLLNSRFSEGIYLGVVAICRSETGINLKGQGEPIEAAVLMRYIPEERTLRWMLEQDRVTGEMMDSLADRIAAIHGQARTGADIASFGSIEVISLNLRENFTQTEPYIGRTLDADVHRAIALRALDFVVTRKGLFRGRVEQGFIRDCHGDLHADHVVFMNGIVLVDCIEFNDRFRYGDTASDLGFLLMDLDFHGYPAFSGQIASRYAQSADDPNVLELLGFYKSYRAFVRGKVLGFRLDEAEVSREDKESARETARLYFQLSLSYLAPLPPVLIITMGFSGTGKSYLAARLGKRLGAELFRSDVVRRRIFQVPHGEHRLDKFGEGIYRRSAMKLTYGALFDESTKALEHGRSVILDASFLRFEDRESARDIARRAGARFRMIECVAPDEILRERLEKRVGDTEEVSDARWEILQQQKAIIDPIRPEESQALRIWDSTRNINSFLASFVRELLAT